MAFYFRGFLEDNEKLENGNFNNSARHCTRLITIKRLATNMALHEKHCNRLFENFFSELYQELMSASNWHNGWLDSRFEI